MKALTRKRLGMAEEIMSLIENHGEHCKIEVSVYGVQSVTLIPDAKKLFKGRLHHFDDSGPSTSWIRFHNGKKKNNDYLEGDLSFVINYPKERGGE